jgi:hypothetical protein
MRTAREQEARRKGTGAQGRHPRRSGCASPKTYAASFGKIRNSTTLSRDAVVSNDLVGDPNDRPAATTIIFVAAE